MKYIWILSAFLVAATVSADTVESPLLICLAREEESIHQKKIKGPPYFLNQFFINEFSAYGHLKLKEPHSDAICGQGLDQVSFKLMKTILTNDGSIFDLTENNPNTPSSSPSFTITEELRATALRAFFGYLSYVEASSPKASCLESHIPHLKEMRHRYNHLQNHPSDKVKKIDMTKVRDILSHLEGIKPLYAKCQKDK